MLYISLLCQFQYGLSNSSTLIQVWFSIFPRLVIWTMSFLSSFMYVYIYLFLSVMKCAHYVVFQQPYWTQSRLVQPLRLTSLAPIPPFAEFSEVTSSASLINAAGSDVAGMQEELFCASLVTCQVLRLAHFSLNWLFILTQYISLHSAFLTLSPLLILIPLLSRLASSPLPVFLLWASLHR